MLTALMQFVRDEDGQAATEYVLVISVMVIALLGATSAFYDPKGPFVDGLQEFSRNVGVIVADDSSPLLPASGP